MFEVHINSATETIHMEFHHVNELQYPAWDKQCIATHTPLVNVFLSMNKFSFCTRSINVLTCSLLVWPSGAVVFIKIVQVMASRLFSLKPLPGPTLTYSQLAPKEQTSVNFL